MEEIRLKAEGRVQQAEPTKTRGIGESQASHHGGRVVSPGRPECLRGLRPPPAPARRGLRLRGEVQAWNRQR